MADNDLLDYLVSRGNRLTFGVLSDPQDREPVVPPDLHLVKAVKPDADGNIACLYCGRKVPFDAAQIVGSDGMACGTCRQPEVAAPADGNLRRRVWPWLIGVPLALGGVVFGIWHHSRAMDREDYERQYPVANTSADDELIARSLARWQPQKVLAGVKAPPALASLHLGAACDLPVADANDVRAGDTDAVDHSVGQAFADVKRGRYYDDGAKRWALRWLAGPIVVVAVTDEQLPEMANEDGKLGYYAGHRTGAAYVYDIDGALRCAGSFDVESSDTVKYWTLHSKDPRIDGDQRVDAHQAVASDLETRTDDAVRACLRQVAPGGATDRAGPPSGSPP